jgi:hypothetical protein
MDWKKEPSWLCALSPDKTKKALVALLAARGLRKTFMDRQEIDHYIHTVLRWPWCLQWRSEQEAAIDAFFSTASREVVIQAVFGSGKTTMMLAMIHTLLVKNYCEASQIVVFAFNVAIKNEIRKRLQNPGIGIRTYDSLIYALCAEMEMDLLHLPTFEGKRRFVRALRQGLLVTAQGCDLDFVFMTQGGEVVRAGADVLVQRTSRDCELRGKTRLLSDHATTASMRRVFAVQICHHNLQGGGSRWNVFHLDQR